MSAPRPPRYWHGGHPDLKPGDFVIPASESGTTRSLAEYSGPDLRASGHVRLDRVHLTTQREAARAFAAAYPNGALYRVEPVGVIEPDPDAPDVSIRCERAQVVAVYDPCVRWAERGMAWLRPLLDRKAS